jgi:Type ISP C-terminal specificity domain
VPFDADAIERVSYRPLDRRYLYNRREYVDFPKRGLQEAWGTDNIALFAAEDGTGAGPAVWCHSIKPDQHALKGSYGGWVFPFRNHNPESRGHFLAPALIGGLSAAYGRHVAPIDVFDAILALLSASSYTTRFALDLEDNFPHVPFPADPDTFSAAARLGARIRALEGFIAAPEQDFCTARLIGQASGPTLDVPSPARAFTTTGLMGTVALLRNQSLRMTDVSERVWRFEVSGHLVLYKWLRARNGTPVTGPVGAALLRKALDIAARIAELLSLFDQADEILANALGAPLTRVDLALTAQTGVVLNDDDDAPG